jgi:DNA-binding transcriptional MocR family regulator
MLDLRTAGPHTVGDDAPEPTLCISGLSETLSPGLRIGMLVIPAQFLDCTSARLQATSTMASPRAMHDHGAIALERNGCRIHPGRSG